MALSKQIINSKFEKLPFYKLIVLLLTTNLVFALAGLLSKFILPPEIPLFFGLPQTKEQLAPSLFIVMPPLISLVFILLNSVLAINLENIYLKKALAFTSLAVTLLSSIAVVKIIFLVGSI